MSAAALSRRRARLAAEAAEIKAGAPLLALPGPSFASLDFDPAGDGSRFVIAGEPLYLDSEARAELSGANHMVQTASSVWDCAIVLARVLDKNNAEIFHPGLRVLELGAGTGLVGVAAAKILAAVGAVDGTCNLGEVVITDVGAVVPALERTIAANGNLPARAAKLDWFEYKRDLEAIGLSIRPCSV